VSVAAIIPNKDGGQLIERCLDALERASGVDEIVVVDDGSSDGTPERAAARGVGVLRSDGSGFAAALNHGVAATGAEYVLVLNSDAFVEPDTVALLTAALDAEPRLALCGAGLVDESGGRAKSHGDLLTLRRALEIALAVPGSQPPETPGAQLVEFVPLACVLVRRSALAAVGGLDESFPFYFEDYDLCWRLQAAGWLAAVQWDARAVHVGGGSSSARHPAAWLPVYHAGRVRYLRRRYPRGWLSFAVLWAPNAVAHAVLWEGRAALAREAKSRGRAREWANAYARTMLPRR
jgi:N-acetylglucosaminyl-diphospho-decaprenol L-rhamnosyltransferase